MLSKLFSAPSKTASVPEGQRIYAIGDVHGRRDLLDAMLEKIAEDAAGAETPHMIVMLGDYVDRGPDSRGVVDRLIALREEAPGTRFLVGNHEDAMIQFMLKPEANYHWLDWGGIETAESYGVRDAGLRQPRAVRDALLEKLSKDHMAFLDGLELTFAAGDYFFVHAGVRPGVPLEEQAREDMLWIRDLFLNAPKNQRPNKVVVHGHTPIDKPADKGWRINVDTGAGWGKALTCVVLEDTTRRFISVS